jgi:hypothetical protein
MIKLDVVMMGLMLGMILGIMAWILFGKDDHPPAYGRWEEDEDQ